MRGKEGDVDNPFIVSRYDNGVRAYIDKNGTPFHQHNGERRFVYASEELNGWHALRAYQDEQRKKGEQINYDFQKINEIWYGRNHIADGIKYHYCGASAGGNKITPEIAMLPGAKMGDFPITGGEYGGFKNFRWRPGHGPREKAKVRIGPDYLSVVYPPFEIPKGGSNG